MGHCTGNNGDVGEMWVLKSWEVVPLCCREKEVVLDTNLKSGSSLVLCFKYLLFATMLLCYLKIVIALQPCFLPEVLFAKTLSISMVVRLVMTCGGLYKLSTDCGDGEDTKVVNVVMTLVKQGFVMINDQSNHFDWSVMYLSKSKVLQWYSLLQWYFDW